MAEMKLIGAVGIKVRPVAKDFKDELNRQINNLPEKTVAVKVDADTRAAQQQLKKVRDEAERDSITLHYEVDYDGLRNAQQTVRQALKKIADKPVQIALDTKSLKSGLDEIENRLANAKIQMHVAQDEAGFRAVLAKIAQIKRQKTEIEFPFTADTKGLEKAEREARKKLSQAVIEKGIKIQYVEDREGLAAAIATIDEALRNLKKVEINPKLNKEELQRERDRLQAELDAKPAILKINKDVEGYSAALAKIRALQREAAQVKFTYKTDEAGLKEAADKLEKWKQQAIEKAGVTLTYKNDRAGLEGAIGELDKQLDKLRQVTINPKLNEAALLRQQEKLKRELAAIPLEVSYNEDRDGIKQAIARLEELKRNAAEVKLQYKDDPEGLDAALDLLRMKLDAEPAMLKIAPDEKGYEAALKQIEELQRQAGAIEFEYGTDEQGLKDAADKLRKSIADIKVSPTIDFKYKNDTTGIRGALDEVEKAIQKLGYITITADLDEAALLKEKAKLEALLKDSKYEIEVDTKDLEALRKEREKLHQLLTEEASEKFTLDVGMNEDSLRNAKSEIDRLIYEAEANPVKLDVEPIGIALAAQQIGWASRSRVVPFYIRIDEKSRQVAEGVLKSLAGYNTLSSIGSRIEDLVTNFDSAIVRGGMVAVVIGGIVDTLGFALTNVLSIGEGMAEAIGVAATAPAALSAAAAVVLVNVAAFRDFKDAIDGTKGALEKLPPNAQAAALALRGTWEAIQQPIQNAYWESMGTSLQDMVKVLLPKFRDGLTLTGEYVGLFAKNTADTLSDLGSGPMFDHMFANLGEFFKQAAGIAEPLTRAINTLGLRGSEYLPQFGSWLTDISNQLNNWIQTADQAGDINTWIDNGVQSLKDMWTAGDGVLDVIRGITKASMAAGGQTLRGLANEMQRWGDIANGQPFQSRLTEIFEGARQGASNLNAGFINLTSSLGESSEWLSRMLTILGDLGGITLSNIAVLFRNDSFRGGLYAAVFGLRDMMNELGPSFDSVATIIGNLGTTAAATFRGLAPLINVVTGSLETVTEILGGELPQIATLLTGQLTNTFTVAANLIIGVTRAIEPLIQGFLKLPSAIQTALLAVAGFTIMRGQISKALSALSEKGHFKAFEGSWRSARTVAGAEASRLVVAGQMVGTGVSTLQTKTSSGLTAMGASWANYRKQVGAASGPVAKSSTAMLMPIQKSAQLGMAGLGGLVGLLGGPLGAALTVATVGVSLYAGAQANARAKVEALADSMDQQTGAATENTKKLVATDWMQSATGKWDNFWRGVVKGSKAAHETVDILGDSTEEVTNLIAEGGPEYDTYIRNLETLAKHLDSSKTKTGTGDVYHGAIKSMQELSQLTGYSVEDLKKLNSADLKNLITSTENARSSVEKAEAKVRGMATALGVGEAAAAKMSGAVKTLGDESSTASERVEAMKTALERLSGGELSEQQAARDFAKAWESSMETIYDASLNATTGAQDNLGYLIDDIDGHVTDLRGRGGVLYDATKSFTDAMLVQASAAAQHVLDNKGTMEEAQAAGVKALQLSEEQMAEFARSMGVEVWEAEKLLSNFLGQDWQANAILGADSEFFFKEMAKAEAAGKVFDEEAWNASLRARNLTEAGISEAMADGQNWTDAELNAVLRAMPEDAMKTLAGALGVMDDSWMRGDFSAIMTAMDGTAPGVSAALFAIAAVTDGDYTVPLKALADALALEEANSELDGAANADRSAHITAVPHTGDAQLAFEMTADDRDAHITGRPHTEDANNKLNTTANPRDARITGRPQTEDANNRLNTTANPRDARITGRPETGTAEDRLNRTGRNRESWFNGRENLYATNNALNHLARNRNPWFIAQADTAHAAGQLAALSAQRTVYYRAVVENPGIRALHGAIVNGSGVQTFANGGILTPQVKRYASGGYENHIAEISRGQTPHRIWSEPETGGEAYIPLSPQKRARSTQILEQVATQFGMKLMDSNATRFASGGIVDGGRTGQGVSVNIGSYVTSQTDTPDDVARALMRRIKVQGANSPLEAF